MKDGPSHGTCSKCIPVFPFVAHFLGIVNKEFPVVQSQTCISRGLQKELFYRLCIFGIFESLLKDDSK